MARNRKRAKERRARRADTGLGRPGIGTPPDGAPNPLEHAVPDVELADAQLALGSAALGEGALPEDPPQSFVEESELEPEDDYGNGRADVPAATVAVGAGPRAGRLEPRASLFGRLIGFLQGSWRELQRVQWPDRRQVAQATSVVIGFVILAGVFLGVADFVFSHLMSYILK